MRQFLTTTAVAMLLAAPIHAASHSDMPPFFGASEAGDLYGSELIGMRLYTSEPEVDESVSADLRTEWNDVGEINDLLNSEDGTVKAVLLDIGGFLGIGEKTVAVDMNELRFVTDPDSPDEQFIVVSSSQEMLENRPAFERADHDEMAMASETAPETATETEATEMASEAETQPVDGAVPGMWNRPDIQREGFEPVEVTEMTAELLDGARVYSDDGGTVGEISNLVVSDDGTITKAVVDVGGFLGIGEHTIAIEFQELQILRASDGGQVWIQVGATQDELEQRPEYAG